jgi:aspartyl-tRNA(Asn)/glutamyl-tRNA(Gln) amidotransferase subunit C
MGRRMSVSHEDIERVARLAALAVDDATLPALTKQISDILDYVSQLEQADIGPGQTGSTWLGEDRPQSPRQDEVRPADLHRALKDIAPAFREDLFLVPRLAAMEDE